MGTKRFVLFVALLGVASMVPGSLDFGPQAAGKPRPVVRFATRSDTTIPVREMPTRPPAPDVLGQIFVKPLKRLPNRVGSAGPEALDPVLQETFPNVAAPATGSNFEGVANADNAFGVLPPDTVGAIGKNHYVQMVNLSFDIFDRNGNSLLLGGPVDNSTLWAGFGGPCETTNDGDPIVLYDHLADRWMMSQFALPGFPFGPFYQCVAVSQTGDPTGSWHLYEFEVSSNKLNDYPKFGVWPDGYYMAVNQYKCNFRNCRWGGQGVVAFERDQMLQGLPARMVYFDLQSVDSDLGGMLPADLDGPVPPAGAPNPFVMVEDDIWGAWPDRLRKYDFHVDWSNPANSTFTFDRFINTAPFDSNLCGYSRNCIPQGSGAPVDAISDRLMFPLKYRNFGTHQSMVVNHTVDVGDNHAGVRWYELRDSGGGWGVHQQGTYAPPDPEHRWMGSIAMNSMGDIGLGFSVASGGIDPSIGYTGRLAGDSLGDMTQGEGEIISGTGYQTHGSGRWGDYSSMTVDPVDDCTFWYTQEYYASIGVATWQTRIGSFKLRDCGVADNPPDVGIVDPVEDQPIAGTYRVLVDASDTDGPITKVELSIDGGTHSDITGDIDAGKYFYDWDTTGETEGAHTLQARATGDAPQIVDSVVVNVTVDNVNDPPVAAFGFVCGGLTCNFNASGSNDPDGNIASYAWDFGDTNGGSGVTPEHPYGTAGTYTVTLIVTDDDGTPSAPESKDVTVSDAAPNPEGIGCSPNSGSLNQRLPVTVSGTGFQDGATVDFGARVAVQSVTFVDATELTVRIKIQRRATTGPRDVTVINPDGGSGIGVGCFQVN